MLRLSDLSPGEIAKISGFYPGNKAYRQKLLAMGLTPNTHFEVIRRAPLGDPIQIRIRDFYGVTVEKKTGSFDYQGYAITVVDLPGVYSTSVVAETGALDEKIACEYLLSGEADVLVNIVDASNLERNLYLTLQLLEMQIPVILAVNMMDIVKRRGIHIDLKRLGKRLGCPVIGMVAKRGEGIPGLKEMILKASRQQATPFSLPLSDAIQQAAQTIATLIPPQSNASRAPWLALRLLEGDVFAAQQVSASIVTAAQQAAITIEKNCGEDVDILIADARYHFINTISQEITQLLSSTRRSLTTTIDRIVLNRYLGIPIFFAVMYFMFLFAINVGGAFQDFFDISSTTLFVNGIAHEMIAWHAPVWITALLANGIGKGMSTTITFIPVIGAMFLFLAFLEDSGYMARAAFVMDRFMYAVGLPGRSFVPMIVGFGCNVPAVMGARTLENRRDRILTIMMMPFMSCGARLAIFAVFASAFFPVDGAGIIFILYMIGILVAVLSGMVLRKTVLPGNPAPLVMELPPYHVPRLGALSRHAWSRLKSFLTRAGKVIIPACILIGILNSMTVTGQLIEPNGKQSLLSHVGRTVTPIFTPMGIQQNNWPATVGLTTGILAKEVVIGTLNTLYSEVGNVTQREATQFNLWSGLQAAVLSIPNNLSALGQALKNPVAANEAPHEMNKIAYGMMYERFASKAAAFAYLLFVLLYFPCISTMAMIRREIGRKWAYFSVGWSTGLAYALAVLCYQLLTITAHPFASALWITSMVGMLAIAIFILKRYAYGHPDKKPVFPTQGATRVVPVEEPK